MKKLVKIIVIVAFSLIVLTAGLFGFMKYRIDKEIKTLCPAPTGLAAPDLYVIRDTFTNFYVIKNNDAYVAFDAGNDIKEDLDQMRKLEIDPLKVSAVFLTHTDADHVASVALFKNAVFYISRDEEQLLTGKIHRFFILNNSLPVSHVVFDDGQIIDAAGVKVQAIVTPGHTPGSACFVVNDTYLFTGDTIGLRNGVAGKFSDVFNMDTKTQLISHDKLKKLTGISVICTGHHGITYDFRKAFGELQ